MINSYKAAKSLTGILSVQERWNPCPAVLTFQTTIWKSYPCFCVFSFLCVQDMHWLSETTAEWWIMYDMKKKKNKKKPVHCPESTVLLAVYYIYARQTIEQTSNPRNLKLKPSQVERENIILDSRKSLKQTVQIPRIPLRTR